MTDLRELRNKADNIAARAKTEDARELATVVAELCHVCATLQVSSPTGEAIIPHSRPTVRQTLTRGTK